MIDAHTHLNDEKLFSNWQEYLKTFELLWWTWLVNVWTGQTWNERALHIAKSSKDIFPKLKIWATIWYHPEKVASWEVKNKHFEEKIFELKKLYNQNDNFIWALWEFWLDSHYDKGESIKDQMLFFDMQMNLSKMLNIWAVIHSRDEIDKTLEILKNYKDQKIYLHCYTYDLDDLKKVLKVLPSCYIGFTGIATYKNAISIQDALKYFWINEKILMETDAPYLSPVPMRWKQNEPSYIDYIYDFVSKFFNIEKQKLISQIEKNFFDFYNF